MAKKVIRPLHSEYDYEAAIDEIERYFDAEPNAAVLRPTASIYWHCSLRIMSGNTGRRQRASGGHEAALRISSPSKSAQFGTAPPSAGTGHRR